jgi:hypothetical protein
MLMMRFVCVLATLVSVGALAQQKIYVPQSATVPRGHIVTFPQGYQASAGQGSPLLIFLHGSGERGNQGSDLTKLESTGLPQIMNGTKWDKTLPFIVVAPQLTSGDWWDSQVTEIYNYAVTNYNVDKNRVYFTGLSLGSLGSWTAVNVDGLAKKVAATLPVSGKGGVSSTICNRVRKIGIWSFNGNTDDLFPINDVQSGIDSFNACNPVRPAKLTTMVGGHSASVWNTVYENGHGASNVGGDGKTYTDVYRWLLSFKLHSRPLDFTDDGRSDILLRNTDGSLYGLLMNGTASTSGAYITAGNAWNVAATGDLNGDGKADIVLRNNNDGSLYALLMDGTSVVSGAFITTGNTWNIAGTADLNGDGKADIVLRQTDGSLYLVLMNGTAVQSGAYLTTGNTWTLANTTSLDLNGDGRSDIILRQTDGSLYAMLMNGTTVQSGAYLTTGNTWTLANATTGTSNTPTDLNGDGRSDIILRQTDGSLYLLLMNGTTVQSGAYLTTGNTWALATTADFDGDGKSDIMLRQTNGSLYMLLMNGTTVQSGAYLATGNTWSFRTAADYNGDGKSDIVIQNTDGSSYILVMNGTAVTSGAYLLGPGAPWSVTP